LDSSDVFVRIAFFTSMKKFLLLLFPLLFFSGCALFETRDSRLHTFHTVVLDPGHGSCDPGVKQHFFCKIEKRGMKKFEVMG